MSRKKTHEEETTIVDDVNDRRPDESVPSDEGTDLQIVPVGDSEVNEQDATRDRHIIYDILKDGVGLPWVHPASKKQPSHLN